VTMMGFAYSQGEFILPWPSAYLNHSTSCWVRASTQNFDWTLQHTQALLDEFAYRQKEGNQHAYRKYVDWIASNLPLHNLERTGQTDWPRCFGKYRDIIVKSNDAVYDYRRYYMIAKKHLAQWTKRPVPDWFSFRE